MKRLTQIGCLVLFVGFSVLIEECMVEARGGGRGGRSSRYRGSGTRGGGGGGDIPWWTYLVALGGAALVVGIGIFVAKWCVKHKCDQQYPSNRIMEMEGRPSTEAIRY